MAARPASNMRWWNCSRAQHSLRVRYPVADNDQQMLEWLRSGAGDVITTRIRAADVAADSELTQARSYFHSASVLVGCTGSQLHDLQALAGKRVAVLATRSSTARCRNWSPAVSPSDRW